ncbi:MAG: Hint domain-containing protein [Archangium sp.]
MKRWLVVMSAMAQMACCIARGAKVKTPRGLRLIEELKVGDEVVVVDPSTLEEHVGRITEVKSAKRECSLINSLRLTSAHPLFDTEKNEWAPAGDWLLGSRTHFATVKGPSKAEHVERFVGIDEVFDLSVDHPLHTFVADGVVVHNKTPLGRNECRLADSTAVEPNASCRCGTDAGRIKCDSRDFAACSCDTSRERWTAKEQTRRETLEDLGRWTIVDCDTQAYAFDVSRPSTMPPSAKTDTALNISSGASCGRLVSNFDDLGPPMWLFFERGSTRKNATVFTLGLEAGTNLKLIEATDEEYGVRVSISGLANRSAIRFTARDLVPYDRWVQMRWTTQQLSDGLIVRPKIVDPFFNVDATSFELPDGGATLDAWLEDGGRFEVASSGPLRLGIAGGTGPTWVK